MNRSAAFLAVFLTQFAGAQMRLSWVAQYDGPASNLDRPESILTDAAGNVYVTGWSEAGPPTNGDCTTIKYDRNGVTQWVARWNGPDSYWDYGVDLAINSAGELYVAAYTYGGPRAVLLKYDANGGLLWSRILADGVGVVVALDSQENVYFGASAGGYPRNLSLWKFDPAGNEQWYRGYDGPAASHDNLTDIAIDADDNIFVLGEVRTASGSDEIALLKYNDSGALQWTRLYTDGIDNAVSNLARDSFGNIYIGARTRITYAQHELMMLKYDTNGTLLYRRAQTGPDGGEAYPEDIAVDSADSVVMTGWTQSNLGGAHWTTVKYDAAGNQLWVRNLLDTVGDWNVPMAGVQFDASDNVFVGGYATGGGGDADLSVIEYDPDGTMVWQGWFAGSGAGFDGAQDLLVDERGIIHAVGSSAAGPENDDYLTIKFVPACEGDINADGEVGLFDLTILLQHFGTESGAALEDGDLDGDHDVDLQDLATLLSAFGTVCST
ncbi:MAG: SBBP repeat-containing protein [Planctomycetes bacterium]|nr:SBBP repeat-containing protein [Planctomycetota bacterium]